MKTAIITGITGQDGAYLSKLLLEKDYTVYGTYRRTASMNFWRIEELGVRNNPNLHLVGYDLTDPSQLSDYLKKSIQMKFTTWLLKVLLQHLSANLFPQAISQVLGY